MKDQTAMERLLYLVRTVGVEFQIRPCPVASGVMITLSLPNGWRYTAQRVITDHDIESANVPPDALVRHAVNALEQQLRTDGTDASHGQEPKRERLARGYGYRGVSPIQFYTSLMGPRQFATLDNPEPRFQTRTMKVDWGRVNKALVDWYRKSADWPRLGAIDL